MIYAPHDMPSTSAFIDHWRELAVQAGYPGMYFVAISIRYIPGLDRYFDPILEPFDAVTLLVPQDYVDKRGREIQGTVRRRLKELNIGRLNPCKPERWQRPMRIPYADVVAQALQDMPPGERYLPSVLPGWDNTPRCRFRGVVYEGASPELFKIYVEKALAKVAATASSTALSSSRHGTNGRKGITWNPMCCMATPSWTPCAPWCSAPEARSGTHPPPVVGPTLSSVSS